MGRPSDPLREALSAVITWELAVKVSIGRLALPEAVANYVPSRITRPGTRLRNARAAVVSASSAHYYGSLNGGLQSAAGVLARLGDTEVAARLLQCCRGYGFRIGRRIERVVVEARGGDDRSEHDLAMLDMLDAAQIAVEAIDRHLSNLAAWHGA